MEKQARYSRGLPDLALLNSSEDLKGSTNRICWFKKKKQQLIFMKSSSQQIVLTLENFYSVM